MPCSTVSFQHLMRMTDDTGLLEHADGVLPRRKEGYSTDDQARALWVCLEFFDLGEKYYHQTQEELLTLMDTYLSYLMWVQEEDGHFHNNIAYDRSKEQEQISEDCLGRCLWACALAAEKLPDDARKAAAKHLLFGSLKAARQLTTLRGMAYTMAALSVGYETLPESERSLLRHLAFRMADQYKACRRSDWFWPEPSVTYGNGVIPWGMLRAYRVLADDWFVADCAGTTGFFDRLLYKRKRPDLSSRQQRVVCTRTTSTLGSATLGCDETCIGFV